MSAAAAFIAARDFLLRHRTDQAAAVRGFRWPELGEFNWALDHFDPMALGNQAPGLGIVAEGGGEQRFSFDTLRRQSNAVANHLRGLGVRRGHVVLLMMGNEPALWLSMLACMKLGAVVVPATTLLAKADLQDRFERGGVRHIIADGTLTARFDELPGDYTRIATGAAVPKAFVVSRTGHAADAATAQSICAFLRERLGPYKRIRRLELAELPRTISGKIRRVELRQQEAAARAAGRVSAQEFVEA